MDNPEPVESLDRSVIQRMITRWKLVEEYLEEMPDGPVPSAERALRHLVRSDVPLLLRELVRSRPDLV